LQAQTDDGFKVDEAKLPLLYVKCKNRIPMESLTKQAVSDASVEIGAIKLPYGTRNEWILKEEEVLISYAQNFAEYPFDVTKHLTDEEGVIALSPEKEGLVTVEVYAMDAASQKMEKKGEKHFLAIRPPFPVVEVKVNGVKWNGKTKVGMKDQLTVHISPDVNFLATAPNEARYRIPNPYLLLPKRELLVQPNSNSREDYIEFRLNEYPLKGNSEMFLLLNDIYRVTSEDRPVRVRFEDWKLTYRMPIRQE